MLTFNEIPLLTKSANYKIHVSWNFLKKQLEEYQKHYALEINPDFQRGYVWTMEQKEKYVEYKLREGIGSDVILFNCAGWMGACDGKMVLVDGKQRLSAVLDFLDNKVKAFGQHCGDFGKRTPQHITFIFHINDLRARKDVLTWYVELNAGGTVHTKEELSKVGEMIIAEG